MKICERCSHISFKDSLLRVRSADSKSRVAALLMLVLGGSILCGASAALAKEKKPQTRTVRGVTTDEADHLISGAVIELTDLQTKNALDVYSDSGGQYQFTDLRFDHDYTVKATYKNLSSETRQISSLDTRTPLEMNLILRKPGS
jgi:hypothetical protein